MTDKEKLNRVIAEVERRYNYHKDHADDWAGTCNFWSAHEDKEILSFIDSMQKEPEFKVGDTLRRKSDGCHAKVIEVRNGNVRVESTDWDMWILNKEWELVEEPETSVWHDNKDTPVASKTKIVLYTNGKLDLFKAYKSDNDFDNYWSNVNQSLEEKGVLVKQWAYVDDLLTLSNLETTKESKKCIYSKDNYTDEDRKVLCDGCKEKCEYIKKEEPVSEDLDMEITEEYRHFHNIDMLTFEEIARHFADWQKQQDMQKFQNNETATFTREEFDEEIEKAKEEARQQIMKDAVEGEVVKDITNNLYINSKAQVNKNNFKFGEKVKILVLKED